MPDLVIPYTEFPVPPTEPFPTLTKRDYPILLVSLSYQKRSTSFTFPAVIDSGADNCVLPAIIGRHLGIQIEAGPKLLTSGVAGSGLAYFHNVRVSFEIQSKPYHFDCFAGFMTDLDQMGVGLLGRHGFFDLFETVAFNNSHRLIELTVRRPAPRTLAT